MLQGSGNVGEDLIELHPSPGMFLVWQLGKFWSTAFSPCCNLQVGAKCRYRSAGVDQDLSP